MSVLRLVKKKHIPVFSLLLSILLLACFIVMEKQDKLTHQQLITQYQQQNLLKIEKAIYVEFVERRFNIERMGSEANLERIHRAAQDKNPENFITLLLNDRFFYPYLFAEGRLFMGDADFTRWNNQREEIINPIIAQLNEFHFALSVEQNRISNFISYLFMESSRFWLALNILILLVFGGFLEHQLGRSKTLFLFFSSTFFCGIVYQLLSDKLSLSLQGMSGPLCALMGGCLMQIYFNCRAGLKMKPTLALALMAVLVVSSYLSLLLFWGKVELKGLSLLVAMLIVGGGLYAVLWRIELHLIQMKAKTGLEDANQTGMHLRTELAKVMELISIFNFDKARDQLRLMSEHYPNSPEVMEQRYHIEKLYPNEAFYWACARKLVNYAVAHHDYARMTFIFEDIQKNAPSKQRAKVSLEPEYYHKMMAVFVAHEDLNRAEKAFLFLELAGQKDIIKEACLLLIDEFKSRGTRVKQQQYQMLFERIFF
jgi:membrane associated rhomboid family serine protease